MTELRILGSNLNCLTNHSVSFQVCTETRAKLYQRLLWAHRDLSEHNQRLQEQLGTKGIIFLPEISLVLCTAPIYLFIFFFISDSCDGAATG